MILSPILKPVLTSVIANGNRRSAFSPLSLSPALWLSDTGSSAATWPDLSGNGRDATQATTGSQPAIVTGAQNGRQVRRFDGINDKLVFGTGLPSANQAHTVIIAASRNSGTPSHLIAWGEAATNKARFLFADISASIFSGFYANDKANWGSIGTGAFLITWQFTGSIEEIWKNGTSLASRSVSSVNTTNSSALNQIGGYVDGGFSGYLNGDIYEILVFPTALNTTDRQSVEAYLRAKWGTP